MKVSTHKKPFTGIAFLLILFGFALRLWGIQFGLPHLYHADEPIVVNHAISYGSGNFNPHFFNIPPLTSYLLFGCYGSFFLLGKVLNWFTSSADFLNSFLSDPTPFYLIARVIFGALAGTLSLCVFYRTMLKNTSYQTALATLFFFAFNFLHARDSHYIYCDIPMLLACLLAFHYLISILQDQEQGMGAVLKFGFWLGAATAFKYNGIFILSAALPCLFFGPGAAARIIKKLLFGVMIAGVVFILLNPYSVLDYQFFLSELAEQGIANKGAGVLHHIVYSLREAFGLPFLVLIIAAIAHVIKYTILIKTHKEYLVAQMSLAFVICYYMVLIFKAQAYGRYVLPLIPFLCYLAAFYISRLENKLNFPRVLTFLIVIVVTLIPAGKLIAWNAIMSKQDTRTAAKIWIENYLQTNAKVALDWDFYMPRLNFSNEQLNQKLSEFKAGERSQVQEIRINSMLERNERENYFNVYFLVKNTSDERFTFAKPVISYNYADLVEEGIQYVIAVETYRDNNYHDFYSDLEHNGKLLKVFTPYKNINQKQIDKRPLTGGPFTLGEIALRLRNGPIIKVYKIS